MPDSEERGKEKENPYHVNDRGIYLSKKKKKNTANELSFLVLSVLYTVNWLIYLHNIVSMGQCTVSSKHII